MQINQKDIINPATTNTPASTTTIYQPAFTTVQVIQPIAPDVPAVALPILPQSLWTNPTLQLHWMLAATSYIATATDFSFFGPQTFGSAFDYFNKLGYFDTKHEYMYFIDRYNLSKVGNSLYDAPYLTACALYETNLKTNDNLPQIHPTQNNKGNVIANGYAAFHINFQINFPPKNKKKPTKIIFEKIGFNQVINMPYHQVYTFINSLPTPDIQESAFATLIQNKNKTFTLTWKNKKNEILSSQTLYFPSQVLKNYVKFLSTSKIWHGSEIPIELAKIKPNETKEFKVVYKEENNQFFLNASKTTPIDKTNLIFNINVSKLPINNLYYDVFKTFKVEPYTRCYIWKNGLLPKFLESPNITQQDWTNGIYIIPSIKNNETISQKQPGELTVSFYKSDQTLIGSITSKGKNLKTGTPGILSPVTTYNLHSNQFKTFQEASIDVGVLIKYVS